MARITLRQLLDHAAEHGSFAYDAPVHAAARWSTSEQHSFRSPENFLAFFRSGLAAIAI